LARNILETGQAARLLTKLATPPPAG
jgi:hypothetical protein